MKSSDEIFNNLLNFEEEFNVFDLKIQDVYIWERIRHKIFKKITKHHLNQSATTPASLNKSTEYYRALRNVLKNIVWKNPYRGDEADVFFFGYCRREKLSDGRHWDIISDPVLQDLTEDWILYENPRLHDHATPAKTENIRYWDLIYYLPRLHRELGVAEISFSDEEIKKIKKLEDDLHDWFGISDDLVQRINWRLYRRSIRLPRYKKVLRKVDPKIALTADSARYTFVEACKELNIVTVELQKAMYNSVRAKYNFPGDRPHRTFPDHVFVWGQYAADNIAYPVERQNIHCVGYPYLDMEVEKYKIEKKTNQVLFISAAPYGQELSRLAVDLDERISDWNVKYKLHPGESLNWRERYPDLRDSCVEVIEHGDIPLYQSISKSKYVVGVSSSVLYQALKFDIGLILLNHDRTTTVTDLINRNNAVVVNDANEIKTVLNSTSVHNHDSTYYFEDNAIEKMQSKITSIIS